MTDVVGDGVGAGVIIASTVGVCVVVGNAAGLGGIIVRVSVACVAPTVIRSVGGLFASPNTIATTAERITIAERIPTRTAQRARRWVCRCRASLCLSSISPRSRISRSDVVTLSNGEALNQAFPKNNSDSLGFLHPKEHEASLAWSPQLFSRIQIGLPQRLFHLSTLKKS